jgi:ATP-dependent protease ClpP protease subunit
MLMLVLASAAVAGDAVQLKLKDGSTWRGRINDTVDLKFMEQGVERSMNCRLVQVEDLYVKVEAMITGQLRQKTIFRADIVAMKDTDGVGDSLPPSMDIKPTGSTAANANAEPPVAASTGQCVFVLPMDGGVGQTFRHEEIEMVGKEADKYGKGQIIILVINSNGGSAYESQLIGQTIADIKKNHRVIAWIHKAISAGCQTAMCCDEIYFMTEGTAGSVTTWDGRGTSIKGEELEKSMEALAQIAESAGHNKYIAYAMKTNKEMVSNDKDPKTGKVTIYPDL